MTGAAWMVALVVLVAALNVWGYRHAHRLEQPARQQTRHDRSTTRGRTRLLQALADLYRRDEWTVGNRRWWQ